MSRTAPSPKQVGVACLLLVSLVALAANSRADEPEDAPPDPQETSGELKPASSAGIGGRQVLDALLFLPRGLVNLAALTSTTMASFLEDEQVVPRVKSALRTDDGKLRASPTFSFASGFRPEVGARLTARSGPFASMLRGSIVDQDTFQTEGRLIQSLGAREQTQVFLEGYQQRNPRGSFGGLGPDPVHDPRNTFLPGRAGERGTFLERRLRLITGVSARVATDVEVLLSTSLQRRFVGDPRDPAPDTTIEGTFAPGTVPGAYARSERVYTEIAVRRDTRPVRGPPAQGLLLEGYGGTSQDVRGTFSSALNAGGRLGWFVSLVRQTTILSPSVTLDLVKPVGTGDLPFREYAFSSAFRGTDGRVDRVAALASLDHRWQIMNHVAMRLFVDTTTVAPRLSELRVNHLAWVVGLGLDIHTDTTQIGKVSVGYSSGGVVFSFVYGVADRGFGDRQHR